jgi:hypothetical protein
MYLIIILLFEIWMRGFIDDQGRSLSRAAVQSQR